MTTVTDPAALEHLVERLEALRPDSTRKWGTMTAGEMLCHLGDATDSVLDQPSAEPGRRRWFIKWVALGLPVGWPQGLPTPPEVDPKHDGTKPGDFEVDRQRAIDGLRRFAAAPASALTASHGAFGRMSPRDWQRWAYRHTEHHLKQFGV